MTRSPVRYRDLLTFRLSLQPARYTTFVRGTAFYDEFFERLRALPQVRAVAAINAMPFSGQGGSRSVFIEGRPYEPTNKQTRLFEKYEKRLNEFKSNGSVPRP